MKKRRLNILWIMAALFAFTGCNDFLDIQPVGKQPRNTVPYSLMPIPVSLPNEERLHSAAMN